MKNSQNIKRAAASLLSIILLCPGWLGLSGITLLFALVPLLWISHSYDDSRKSWWRVFGWALLTFVGWNISTIWWIGNATWVGPVAATLFSTWWNMVAFMLFHTVSKKAPKSLAYTLLVAGWIATEYWYNNSDFSWPWLLLGNGFSHDIKLVQWYEYTGILGGSLWVLLCNITLFEALTKRGRAQIAMAAISLLLPIAISLGIYFTYQNPEPRTKVTALQPNVDCYEKFNGDEKLQEQNLLSLLSKAPSDSEFILAPETALTRHIFEGNPSTTRHLTPFIDTLRSRLPGSLFITGANTIKSYAPGSQTPTARSAHGFWYDHFNSALEIDTAGLHQIYHKGKLVIGVENTPGWVFDILKFCVVDLGGVLGQIGIGDERMLFTSPSGIKGGPAICYEGVYGEHFGEFVNKGAQIMFLISNDGWWGDTPGYRHLFTISRLRAVEHRRAIGRSANTGRSGFIDCRGDIVGESLGWEERGVISYELPLNSELTFYTRYGDLLGRVSQLVMGLSILYYIAYRTRKKNYLAE